VAHLFQVGAGSGGMPVLDAVCRDTRITRVTIVEPDLYKEHNVERHLFPRSAVGRPKAELAVEWLRERRPELVVDVLRYDLLDPARQAEIEAAVAACDVGVCAADNEAAKFHFDGLMRRLGKPWTLGEVLSGGIGGFVHWFVPGGPCYGCVASHLQRPASSDYVPVEQEHTPDYSQPGGVAHEVRIPASKASIQVIASLHALITLDLLASAPGPAEAAGSEKPADETRDPKWTFDPGFTTLLLTLQRVPGVFEEAYRPYRFRVARSPGCLVCQAGGPSIPQTPEELDVALDQALARLGNE
jgi:sulfur-carrier protein adenylyltransferase/sulfurtransferase